MLRYSTPRLILFRGSTILNVDSTYFYKYFMAQPLVLFHFINFTIEKQYKHYEKTQHQYFISFNQCCRF